MLPNGLQELFGRCGSVIVQQIDRAAAFAPHRIKIFRPGIDTAIFHAAVFACLTRKVKLSCTGTIQLKSF